MRCTAVPRLDAGAEGIHLAWAGPALLSLSLHGYDIQRRVWRAGDNPEQCEDIEPQQLALLRRSHILAVPLGLLLYRTAPPFRPLTDPVLYPPEQPWPGYPNRPIYPDPFTAGGGFQAPDDLLRGKSIRPPQPPIRGRGKGGRMTALLRQVTARLRQLVVSRRMPQGRPTERQDVRLADGTLLEVGALWRRVAHQPARPHGNAPPSPPSAAPGPSLADLLRRWRRVGGAAPPFRIEARPRPAAGVANPAVPGQLPPGFGELSRVGVEQLLAALRPAGGTALADPLAGPIEVFVQELNQPVNFARVEPTARTTFAIVLSEGKVVDTAEGTGELMLQGQQIDTVVLYAVGMERFTMCVGAPSEIEPRDDDSWSQVPYIARAWTLPLQETDARLNSPAEELTAARDRLLGGEVLDAEAWNHLADPLRLAVAHPELGRPAERILLLRSNTEQPFEEMSFVDTLNAMAMHPRWRRILGFGYADRASAGPDGNPANGVVQGETYEYRITGHFSAADLQDSIYTVHNAPSGTLLPASVHIRDLSLRFQKPASIVLGSPPPADSLLAVSRRGIAIDGTAAASGGLIPGQEGWLLPFLGPWSLIIDLPRPVGALTLEVGAGHTFSYAPGDAWNFLAAPQPLPNGIAPTLRFDPAVSQVRLQGSGTLFAVRVPSGAQGEVARAVETGPVRFAAQPPPAPPTVLVAYNLQPPPTIVQGQIGETTQVPPRPAPGFRLAWLPADRDGLGAWPVDLEAAPPLDSFAYQIERRQVYPGTGRAEPWAAIQADDNLTYGTRDAPSSSQPLVYGADLDAVFAKAPRRPGESYALHLSDIFAGNAGRVRGPDPAPPLGAFFEYRIRSMDTVGRVSGTWTLSNRPRLEKRVPPPMPVGPQPEPTVETPQGGQPRLEAPPGVRVRALVAGAPDLTDGDRALLGRHANVVLLDWGWRQNERDLDPRAREFRVYLTRNPPDSVPGFIADVRAVASGWEFYFASDRFLQADECAGQWITSGGYPFLITAHGWGNVVTLRVEAARARPNAAPVEGPCFLARRLRAWHQRPAFWEARVHVEPLTSDTNYRYVFYDVLQLGPNHPLDRVWVGVSATDGELYIADELPPNVPNGGRVGNESSLATCSVEARYHGRPQFAMAPPLDDVPEFVTEEPVGREVLITLELPLFLPNAVPAGSPIVFDRCSSGDVFSILSVNGRDQVTLRLRDDTETVINFANANDRQTVIDTLRSDHPERLPNRYLMHLVTHHPDPEEVFMRVSSQTESFGLVQDRLPPRAGRFFYRVRQADGLGHVSAGGAILPAVVRVPSLAPVAAPERLSLTADQNGIHLSARVPADPEITHLLLFTVVTPPGTTPPDSAGAELLRIPNRRDLYPRDGVRLRAPGGALLTPLVKPLSDNDVVADNAGRRTALLTAPAPPRAWVQCWCCSLSQDGIPSVLAGPFGIGIPRTP